MKSEWYTMKNCIGGDILYIAARTRDTKKVVHAGNIETYSNYNPDKTAIQDTVAKLNAGEIKLEECE